MGEISDSLLNTEGGNHGYESLGFVIRQDAGNNGFDIEFIDTEASNKPFDGLSGRFEKKIGRQLSEESVDAGIQFIVLFFCLPENLEVSEQHSG